jgi:S-DNA-T family DNA segregation ATPase FtsK/SpoIIIE
MNEPSNFDIGDMATKKNTLGSKSAEKPSEKAEKPKRSAGHQPVGNPNIVRRAKKFLSDERTHKIFGAVLLVATIYLTLACASYLFTWKIDHDKVNGNSIFGFLFSSNAEVDNWLGRLGAILSHILIFNWFGLGSFAIVAILFLFGFKLATGISLAKLWRTTGLLFYGMILSSVLLGFLSAPSNRFIGGAFGFHTSQWLVDSTGKIGMLLLWGLSVFAFVVYYFNPSFKLPERSPKSEPDDEPVEESTVKAVNTIRREDIPTEVELPTEPDMVVDDIQLEPVMEIEVDIPEEVAQPLTAQLDEGFSVEVAAAETNLSEDEINTRLEEFGEYDPTLDLSSYTLPSIELLNPYGSNAISINKEELEENLKLIRGLVWTSGGNDKCIEVSLNNNEDHCND